MNAGRRYVGWIVVGIVSGLAVIAGLVAWVDPYGRRVGVVVGFNQYKSVLVDSTRLFAPELISRQGPATLIVGNSRLLVALDPGCPEMSWTPAPRVNACLGSASMYEVRRLVEHAVAQGQLRTVIVAVDWDLYGTASGTMPGWSEARLANAVEGAPQPFHRWADTASTAWSWSAVRDAWVCWQGSRAGAPDRIDLATGFAGRAEYWRGRMAEHGHRGVARWMESTWGRGMAGWQDDAEYQGRVTRMQTELALTLATAWAAGAEVHIVMSPVHVRWRLLLEQLGMGPAWIEHRRRVVATVATAASAQHRSSPPVWDFCGWDGPNAEPFPAEGDRTAMHWWWESNHAQATFGAAIATRLAGEVGPGIALTTANIDAVLHDQVQQRDMWLSNNPMAMHEMAENLR